MNTLDEFDEGDLDERPKTEAEKPNIQPTNPAGAERLTPNTQSLPWSEKHRPKTLDDVAGHGTAVKEVKTWAEDFKRGKSRPLLIYGPSGNGKTTITYALAGDLDYEIVEMNASDLRARKSIEEKIGHAVTQTSLLGKKGKIILIDEIDGIYGTVDRGGLPAIYDIIKKSAYPIVITANDPWNTKFSALRQKCKLIKLSRVNVRSVAKRLREICEEEKIEADEEALNTLARLVKGDMRAAINDLEAAVGKDQKLTKEGAENVAQREKRVEIFDTLLAVFKTKDRKHIMDSFWNSDKSPGDITQWILENIAKEYESVEEVAEAYDRISRADVFSGRIIHNQAWKLMSYASELTALGTALAKKEKYQKYVKYTPSSIIMKMGRTKITRAERDAIAAKIGEHCHCSRKRAIEQFPYFKIIIMKGDIGVEFEGKEEEFIKAF